MRIGPHMKAIANFVEQHPGCCILDCVPVTTARGGHRWTYDAAHRARRAGLIRMERRPNGRYALYAAAYDAIDNAITQGLL